MEHVEKICFLYKKNGSIKIFSYIKHRASYSGIQHCISIKRRREMKKMERSNVFGIVTGSAGDPGGLYWIQN